MRRAFSGRMAKCVFQAWVSAFPKIFLFREHCAFQGWAKSHSAGAQNCFFLFLEGRKQDRDGIEIGLIILSS